MVDHLVNSEANRQRIQRIENSFGSAGISLLKPGRVLLGEGVLTKICKKKHKPRQFFLFNDILLYGNVVIGNKKFKQYNKQRIIPLEEVKLNNIDDDASIQNGWFVCSRSKSFAVYASTPIEKQQWMDHISRAVQEHLKTGNLRASNYIAATMIPDSEAKTCMHCGKTEFTFINRRHHCRKCGMVVCGNCSTQRAVIAEQSDKPQRVCAACATVLSREQSQRPNIISRETSRLSSGATDSPESDDESYEANGISHVPERPSFYSRSSALNKEDAGQVI